MLQEIQKKNNKKMSNHTYAPFLPLSKRGFDKSVINKYMEPVYKVNITEVVRLICCDFMNIYEVSAFRLYN